MNKTLSVWLKTRFLARAATALTLACVYLAAPQAAHATTTVWYVKPGTVYSGTCTSWATACTLPYALVHAIPGDQIWVKAGVYKPTTFLDVGAALLNFAVPSGVAVYGGFAGTESLLSQRNPATHVTILSGDIEGNDVNTDGNQIDEKSTDIKGTNSYHVVSMDGTTTWATSSTILDGFIITGGFAASAFPWNTGGGLYCDATGSGHVCSPTLRNLIFSGNRATYGGGLFNNAAEGTSSPQVRNVTFRGNFADSFGGAVYNAGVGGASSPTFTNVTFSGNSSSLGGAVANQGDASFTANGYCNPVFRNVTFSGNYASVAGGAMYSEASDLSSYTGTSNPTVVSGILWGDTAGTGNEIFESGATTTVTYSIVEGGRAGTGNLNVDPKLKPLGHYGAFTLTRPLQKGSPAIDKGTNTGCPTRDQRGIARPKDGDGNGTKVCDMGATESQFVIKTLSSNAAYDGWVLESGENTDVGGSLNSTATTFNLGDDASNQQYRSILSFKTLMPGSATIVSATLKIKKAGLVGANPFGTLGNLLVDIKKGVFGTSSLQSSDFQATPSKSAAATVTNTPVSGWYSKALPPTSFGYIIKSGITQFRLRFGTEDNNNHVADYLSFYSGNYGTASSRPQLLIKYYVP